MSPDGMTTLEAMTEPVSSRQLRVERSAPIERGDLIWAAGEPLLGRRCDGPDQVRKRSRRVKRAAAATAGTNQRASAGSCGTSAGQLWVGDTSPERRRTTQVAGGLTSVGSSSHSNVVEGARGSARRLAWEGGGRRNWGARMIFVVLSALIDKKNNRGWKISRVKNRTRRQKSKPREATVCSSSNQRASRG